MNDRGKIDHCLGMMADGRDGCNGDLRIRRVICNHVWRISCSGRLGLVEE